MKLPNTNNQYIHSSTSTTRLLRLEAWKWNANTIFNPLLYALQGLHFLWTLATCLVRTRYIESIDKLSVWLSTQTAYHLSMGAWIFFFCYMNCFRKRIRTSVLEANSFLCYSIICWTEGEKYLSSEKDHVTETSNWFLSSWNEI